MTQKIRIDKFLSHIGVGSRTEIKKLVKEQRIFYQGNAVKNSGQLVEMNDLLSVDGIDFKYREFVYLMMNKPSGYISATEDRRQQTVLDLLEDWYTNLNLFPVGRLDKDTEGLLLLTNDGQLAHNMLSPKKHVEKKYLVCLLGELNQGHVEAFRNGIQLQKYTALPAKLKILSSATESWGEVYISEGKFHQIKDMFKKLGMEVKYLKRLKMGELNLDEQLSLGEYKELNAEEMKIIEKYK